MPALVIGLTIVAFGTSVPELCVSAVAALEGKSGLAVGNAIGSNVANVGMVLGLSALLRPVIVNAAILRREVPVMIVVLFATWALLLDGALSRADGLLLLVALALFTGWRHLAGFARQPQAALPCPGTGTGTGDGIGTGGALQQPQCAPQDRVSLVLLPASSYVLVWGATEVARYFGVSELVIGLTIVAFGTSLPEAATGVAAALKGHSDIALGNIIGSNIFNMLGVIGVSGVLSPLVLERVIAVRDMPVMIVMSLAMLWFAWLARRGSGIGRGYGALLFLGWGGYIGYLVTVSLSAP